MTTLLIILYPISLFALIYFEKNHKLGMRSLFKVLTSFLFLFAAVYFFNSTRYSLLIIIGLILSFAGDIVIMFEKNIYFLSALCLFLCAHILYIFAFSIYTGINLFEIVFVILIIALVIIIYRKINLDIHDMKIPVLIYSTVITFMLIKAFSFMIYQPLGMLSGVLAFVGALLFYVSDILLALDKFNAKIKGRLIPLNLTTYYIGQILIAISIFTSV